MTCLVTTSLGAYVVGALDPSERETVEAHLTSCADCTRELAELSALPGLLGRLSLAEVTDPTAAAAPRADDALLDRLLGAVTTHRRTARRRRVLAAAAAVVVLVGGSVGGLVLTGGAAAEHRMTVSATDTHTRVSAAVTVTARRWGTEVELRLSGVAPMTRCRLVAHARDGRSEVTSTWQASYAGTATVPGATGIAVADLTEFTVVSDAGAQLVTVPIS